MNAVSQLFAVLAALVYIVVFPLESFFLRHPAAQKFLSTPAQNVPAVMMWAIPTGFRNLLIGLGNIAGVVAVNTGLRGGGLHPGGLLLRQHGAQRRHHGAGGLAGPLPKEGRQHPRHSRLDRPAPYCADRAAVLSNAETSSRMARILKWKGAVYSVCA